MRKGNTVKAMIEAVSSVIQTAPFVRGNNVQMSTSDSFAGNPDGAQKVAQGPQAPYVSPYIYYDVNFNKAVLQLRNGETGDVVDQFPSEKAMQASASKRAEQQVAAENGSGARPAAPKNQAQSAQAAVQQARPDNAGGEQQAAESSSSRPTAQQQAAFVAAAQAGNSNAGNVMLLA